MQRMTAKQHKDHSCFPEDKLCSSARVCIGRAPRHSMKGSSFRFVVGFTVCSGGIESPPSVRNVIDEVPGYLVLQRKTHLTSQQMVSV